MICDILKKSDKVPIDDETIEKFSEIILKFNRENRGLISNLNLRDLKIFITKKKILIYL